MFAKESQSSATIDGIEDNFRKGAKALGTSISESVNSGKDAITRVAADAADSAKSDLESLRRDLDSLMETVAKFASHVGSEAGKSAREVTSSVVGQASDLAGKGGELASAATGQAQTMISDLETTVRRNPIAALASAVIVGGLIGLLVRRR